MKKEDTAIFINFTNTTDIKFFSEQNLSYKNQKIDGSCIVLFKGRRYFIPVSPPGIDSDEMKIEMYNKKIDVREVKNNYALVIVNVNGVKLFNGGHLCTLKVIEEN